MNFRRLSIAVVTAFATFTVTAQAADLPPRPIYKAPPPRTAVVPISSSCDIPGYGGLFNSGFVPLASVTAGAEQKHLHDSASGASKSDLTFGMFGVEVGVCKTLAQGLWMQADFGYNFSANVIDRAFPGPYNQSIENFDYYTIGGNLMWDANSWLAIGPRLTYNWASLDSTTTGVGNYNVKATTNGEFWGVGFQANVKINQTLTAFGRYEHKIGNSFDTATPYGKPDSDSVKVGLTAKFVPENLFGRRWR